MNFFLLLRVLLAVSWGCAVGECGGVFRGRDVQSDSVDFKVSILNTESNAIMYTPPATVLMPGGVGRRWHGTRIHDYLHWGYYHQQGVESFGGDPPYGMMDMGIGGLGGRRLLERGVGAEWHVPMCNAAMFLGFLLCFGIHARLGVAEFGAVLLARVDTLGMARGVARGGQLGRPVVMGGATIPAPSSIGRQRHWVAQSSCTTPGTRTGPVSLPAAL